MSITIWAKAERALSEGGFKDWFQERADNLLSHPVPNGGDAQGAQIMAFTLRDVDSEERSSMVVAPVCKVQHESDEVVLEVGFKGVEGDPVDTRGAAITLNSFESAEHPRHIDTSGKGMDFEASSSQRTFLAEKSICGIPLMTTWRPSLKRGVFSEGG